jgi:peptidoglycan/xylan/chitin deacetylase (PgdA/CDA1 family)
MLPELTPCRTHVSPSESISRFSGRTRFVGAGQHARANPLDHATGWIERRRRAREDGNVLTIKPRAYYVSTHLLQRARISRLRRANGRTTWHGVRLFGYHRVSDDYDELALPRDMFRRQMEALLADGTQPVSLSKAIALLRDGAPGRYATVTFDDGYHDNLDNAFPVLRDLGIPATIFISTSVTDGGERFSWYGTRQPQLLRWDEIVELDGHPLISFGAHTRTHPALPLLSEERARTEIAGSKRDLERRLGRTVPDFCYPAGLYGDREARLVHEAGFSSGVTCEPGVNEAAHALLTLRRTMIDRRDTMVDFQAKLAGWLDRPLRLRQVVHRHRARGAHP